MKVLVFTLLITLGLTSVSAQQDFGCVCSTDVPDATAPNNSHKLAFPSEIFYPDNDTVTLVFQSAESIYISYSGNGSSQPWSTPIPLYPGQNPGITFGRDGDRHLVWEMADTASGAINIFYLNLEYRMAPVNVSCSDNNCYHPDVLGDSSGIAHIVWEEETPAGGKQIWYRTANETGVIGDRFCLGSTGIYALPAIDEFKDTITVVYQRFDSTLPRPYAIIRRRQVNGNWQQEEVLMDHMFSLNHPSLDFGCEGEPFSAAWDVDFDGNLEAHFVGGNGGGYSTSGVSTAPVVANVGTTWSYLFWEEDSFGIKDIYTHFYYFMSGWYNIGSIRNFFNIAEPVGAPNCLGALAVWTQGDTPPYKVMWGFFNYPIGIKEQPLVTPDGYRTTATIARGNLFLAEKCSGESGQPVLLLDISGRRAMELRPGRNDVRHLTPGVYFLRNTSKVKGGALRSISKVVITR